MAKHIRTLLIAVAGAAMATTAQGQGASSAPKSDSLSKAAAVYGTYQSSVTDIKTQPLSSAGDIDDALKDLGGHNSSQLTKGFLAYSALVAAQSPEYRAALRDLEGHYGRDRVLLGLKNNYAYARTLKGGNSAVGSALSATDADSRRLKSAAAYVKEQAYSLQSAGWAKAKIGNSGAKANSIMSNTRSGRPANGSISAALSAPGVDNEFGRAGSSGAPSLWEGVSSTARQIKFPAISSRGGSSKRVLRGKEQVADRIATLAAYRLIGANSSAESAIQSTMADQGTTACMNMASLNLQQCVAAAHKQYEVPFCIGQHALAEIGDCITVAQ